MNYYYRDKTGREIGPLALDTLAKFHLSGVLNGDTLVREEKSTEWKSLREILPDLQAVLPENLMPTASVKSKVRRNGWIFLVAGLVIAASVIYSAKDSPKLAPAENSFSKKISEKISELDIVTIRRNAENGDASAQYQLGKILTDGERVEKDSVQAVEWFRKSAKQNNSYGQNALGVAFNAGNGVEPDIDEALKWFRAAADQENPKAQFNLGRMYRAGTGVEKDEVAAIQWFRKSANQNYGPAQYILARMYQTGYGVEKDSEKAAMLFTNAAKSLRKAANEGEIWASLSLGEMHEEGTGVPKDQRLAIEWYRKASSSHNEKIKELATERLRELDPSPEERERTASITCVNNLKQIGLSFRIWAGDNEDKYPYNLSTNGTRFSSGGTMEFCLRGADGFDQNAAIHFRALENELGTPKILVCPADTTKHSADNFQSLSASSITYRLRTGSEITEDNPSEILAICPIHHHTLYCDGRVIQGKGGN